MIFPHRVLEGAEEQAVIDHLMARIPTLNCAGTKDRWEKGWTENLEAYKLSGDVADLRPKYIRDGQPLRLNGKFVMPHGADIEAKWYEHFFAGIANKWLKDVHAIWEFGCGSGHNVAWLARRFPGVNIHGADWSRAAAEICWSLPFENVGGCTFDFFNPKETLKGWEDLQGSAVLTVGALEQTGKNWMPFLEYLLAAKPRRAVHIEPVAEWYDPYNKVDATALAAHDARGFWRGFPAELQRRVGMGEVEILHMERTGFGSLFCEGYSQIVWRPR